MKKLMSVMVVACVVLTGCQAMLSQKPYLPAGAKACTSDAQCDDNERCWFGGVDQFASCKYVGVSQLSL